VSSRTRSRGFARTGVRDLLFPAVGLIDTAHGAVPLPKIETLDFSRPPVPGLRRFSGCIIPQWQRGPGPP